MWSQASRSTAGHRRRREASPPRRRGLDAEATQRLPRGRESSSRGTPTLSLEIGQGESPTRERTGGRFCRPSRSSRQRRTARNCSAEGIAEESAAGAGGTPARTNEDRTTRWAGSDFADLCSTSPAGRSGSRRWVLRRRHTGVGDVMRKYEHRGVDFTPKQALSGMMMSAS